jgi:hypothetical protein
MFSGLAIILQCQYVAASASNIEHSGEIIAAGISQPAMDMTARVSSTKEDDLAKKAVSLIWGVEINACHFGGDEANRLAKEGILIGTESANNYLSLEGGNILLTPEQDMVVATREGKAYIRAGASIFICQSGEGVVFYDLLQTKPKQVVVTVSANKQKIVLEPGRMLVITNENASDFEKLAMDCHRVNYNNVIQLDLQNREVKAFTGNFSIASAMATIEPLRESTKSANINDQQVTDKLVKGAVIMGGFAATVPDTNANNLEADSVVAANAKTSNNATLTE